MNPFRRIWFWALVAASFVWAGLESAAILEHPWGEGAVTAWTLSDTIRDWQAQHHWLRWVIGIVFLGLWLHWFVQRNPGQVNLWHGLTPAGRTIIAAYLIAVAFLAALALIFSGLW